MTKTACSERSGLCTDVSHDKHVPRSGSGLQLDRTSQSQHHSGTLEILPSQKAGILLPRPVPAMMRMLVSQLCNGRNE